MSTGDLNNDLQIDIYDLNNILNDWSNSSNDISNLSNLESNWNNVLNLPTNYDIGLKISPSGDVKIRLSDQIHSNNNSLYYYGASFSLINGAGWSKTNGAEGSETITSISANSFGTPSSITYNMNSGISIDIFANSSGPPTSDYKLLTNNWDTLAVNADKTSNINLTSTDSIVLYTNNDFNQNNDSNKVIITNDKIWHPNIVS